MYTKHGVFGASDFYLHTMKFFNFAFVQFFIQMCVRVWFFSYLNFLLLSRSMMCFWEPHMKCSQTKNQLLNFNDKTLKITSILCVFHSTLCFLTRPLNRKNALTNGEWYTWKRRECTSKCRIQLASVLLVESLRTLHMSDTDMPPLCCRHIHTLASANAVRQTLNVRRWQRQRWRWQDKRSIAFWRLGV